MKKESFSQTSFFFSKNDIQEIGMEFHVHGPGNQKNIRLHISSPSIEIEISLPPEEVARIMFCANEIIEKGKECRFLNDKRIK
jgi:hypothetical protein